MGNQKAKLLSRSFKSLENKAFRNYFFGQGVSLAGIWMQDIALSWFVFEQTGSATAVGLLLATEYIPLLLFGTLAGGLVDRFSKHGTLIVTRSLLGAVALAFALVTSLDAPLIIIYALAVIRGIIQCVNLPASSAFIAEIVEPENMRSAVSLGGLLFNGSRVIGPLLASILVSISSVSVCFIVNAACFAFVTLILLRIDHAHIRPLARSDKGRVIDGWKYVWSVPELRACMFTIICVSTFAYNSQVFFPMLSRELFGNGINTYAYLMATYSTGFVTTAIFAAGGPTTTNRMLIRATTVLGFGIAIAALCAQWNWLGYIAIFGWGSANCIFASHINTSVQLNSAPEMKGRVMAIWNVVLWGVTPIGAPIAGLIGEHFDPRMSLAVASCACLLGSAIAFSILRHRLDNQPKLIID